MMAPLSFVHSSSFGYSSSSSSSSQSSSDVESDEMNPTQLLSVAIRKRRIAYSRKERDLREELMHTGLIQSLCKFLGEGRARRRKHRRSKHGRRRRSNSPAAAAAVPTPAATVPMELEQQQRKREWSDPESMSHTATVTSSDVSCSVELTGTPHSQNINNNSFVGGRSDNVDEMQQLVVQQEYDGYGEVVTQKQFTNLEPPAKVKRPNDDSDPFGLDAIFAEYYGRIPSSLSTGYDQHSSKGSGNLNISSYSVRSSVATAVA